MKQTKRRILSRRRVLDIKCRHSNSTQSSSDYLHAPLIIWMHIRSDFKILHDNCNCIWQFLVSANKKNNNQLPYIFIRTCDKFHITSAIPNIVFHLHIFIGLKKKKKKELSKPRGISPFSSRCKNEATCCRLSSFFLRR